MFIDSCLFKKKKIKKENKVLNYFLKIMIDNFFCSLLCLFFLFEEKKTIPHYLILVIAILLK